MEVAEDVDVANAGLRARLLTQVDQQEVAFAELKALELALGQGSRDRELLRRRCDTCPRAVEPSEGDADVGDGTITCQPEQLVIPTERGVGGVGAAVADAVEDRDVDECSHFEHRKAALGVAWPKILRAGDDDVDAGQALVASQLTLDTCAPTLNLDALNFGATGERERLSAPVGNVDRSGLWERRTLVRRRDARTAIGLAEEEAQLDGGLDEVALGCGKRRLTLVNGTLVLDALEDRRVPTLHAGGKRGVALAREVEPVTDHLETCTCGDPVPVANGRCFPRVDRLLRGR